MPTIRVDDDVFAGLQALAKPFIDTPNSVIRRLLEERRVPSSEAKEEQSRDSLHRQEPTATSHAPNSDSLDELLAESYRTRRFAKTPSGGLTPQTVLEDWIVVVLSARFGGSGEKRDVTNEILRELAANSITSDGDFEIVSTGETKVANTIAWGRNRLKEIGLIRRNSPRGIWELSEQGETLARKLLSAE